MFQSERDLQNHFFYFRECADITANTWATVQQAMAQTSQTTTANTAYRNSAYSIRVAGLFPDGNVPVALQNLRTSNQLQGSPSNVLQSSPTHQNVLGTDQGISTDLPSIASNKDTDADAPPIPAVTVPQAPTATMMNTAQPIATAAVRIEQQQQQQTTTQGQVPVATHTTTQAAVVNLLSLLNVANVPNYLFKSVMKWACKYQDAGFDFCPPQQDHQGNLKWVVEHLKFNHGI